MRQVRCRGGGGEGRSHVARRVRELVDSGAATPGEIVLLFAAGTDAEWYEDELRAAGLPTYRATGKGYFGQQQVVDLLMRVSRKPSTSAPLMLTTNVPHGNDVGSRRETTPSSP